MKAMLKSELARAAGVTLDTMVKYINAVAEDNPIFAQYKKTNKVLMPNQVKFLCEHYSIEIE